MSDKKEVTVMESIYNENDRVAAELNIKLTENNVFCVNVMGAPGVGKTSSLINIIKNLNDDCYVIEGDIESDIDTIKLNSLGIISLQINTNGACHLDSPLIKKAVEDINVKKGVLFIENIGNLVCPAEFMIGEHIKMLISTVTEGSDKPYKYPLAFEKADVIVLNKVDLIPYVDFDNEFFLKGVRALNKDVPVFMVSAKTGEGFMELAKWLQEKATHI